MPYNSLGGTRGTAALAAVLATVRSPRHPSLQAESIGVREHDRRVAVQRRVLPPCAGQQVSACPLSILAWFVRCKATSSTFGGLVSQLQGHLTTYSRHLRRWQSLHGSNLHLNRWKWWPPVRRQFLLPFKRDFAMCHSTQRRGLEIGKLELMSAQTMLPAPVRAALAALGGASTTVRSSKAVWEGRKPYVIRQGPSFDWPKHDEGSGERAG